MRETDFVCPMVFIGADWDTAHVSEPKGGGMPFLFGPVAFGVQEIEPNSNECVSPREAARDVRRFVMALECWAAALEAHEAHPLRTDAVAGALRVMCEGDDS